jgi:hypothetical protein
MSVASLRVRRSFAGAFAVVLVTSLAVVFGSPGASAAVVTSCNNSSIAIPGAGTSGNASPYPSVINIGGLGSPVQSVSVQLIDLNHTFPDDIDVLLVGTSS